MGMDFFFYKIYIWYVKTDNIICTYINNPNIFIHVNFCVYFYIIFLIKYIDN